MPFMELTVTTEATSASDASDASEEARLVTTGRRSPSRSATARPERLTFALQPLTSQLGRALLLALLSLPPNAIAQENDAGGRSDDSSSHPEEITIKGERPQFQLREELWSAERKAYELFNRFNDERRFEISCGMRQPTGTRFETQICQPRFVQEATSANGQAFLESYRRFLEPYIIGEGAPATDGSSSSSMPAEIRIASQQPQYQKKMREIAEQHPEFLDAIIRYSEIRSRYQEVSRQGDVD